MSDHPTPAASTLVAEAFNGLITALAQAAMAGDFDRAAAYRQRVLALSERWQVGEMPFTPRGKKPAAPASEPGTLEG